MNKEREEFIRDIIESNGDVFFRFEEKYNFEKFVTLFFEHAQNGGVFYQRILAGKLLVTEQTVSRWMKKPEFRALFDLCKQLSAYVTDEQHRRAALAEIECDSALLAKRHKINTRKERPKISKTNNLKDKVLGLWEAYEDEKIDTTELSILISALKTGETEELSAETRDLLALHQQLDQEDN